MKFPVSESKQKDLDDRMFKLGLKESDWEERFVKGSGHGGQKVNKTSSTVWLKHKKSGIEVKCQDSRSQSLNRFLARRLLVEKLEQNLFAERSQKQQALEKIKRQKHKRSKRAQEKILKQKKVTSQKKTWRQKPGLE